MTVMPGAIPPVLARRSSPWIVPALVAGAAGLVVVFAFDPARHGFYPRCMLHAWTGLECAGCGSLRALHHLLHGRVATAFAFNPLFVIGIPVLAWGSARALVSARRGREAGFGFAHPAWGWASLSAIALWTIVRNLF